MTNLIATNWLADSDTQGLAAKEMALILSGDGKVCTVMHSSIDVEPNESIDAIWPQAICTRIRDNLRRALRNRRFFSEELKLDDQGKTAEFTFIAQGRDRVLLVARDTSRNRRALTKLKHLAFVDEATALPNREYFLGELDKIIEHQRLREGRAAVICIHFDDIGSQHGATGTAQNDAILHELGERLSHELRAVNTDEDDEFERRSIAARTDFQRFGVILPEIESGTDAQSVADRITQRLQEPVDVDGKAYRILVHAGIGLFPQDGADVATLFANANAATEDARTGQAGDVAFHSGTVKLRTLQRQDLEVELRSALERGAFALNYLPIVDAKTGAVHGIEALLRWPDSVMGSHSTSKVIGLAERTGLIVPIGEWVLRESFDQLKAWQEAGHDDLRLAVNLSMQEFSRPEIAARMAALMLQVGVQPSSIDLEITEKMLGRDAIAGYRAMDALKALGVSLVVDDFGTAACSLAQFAHSPVDGIKIDISLVNGVESCSQDLAACTAAIASAHALGLTVVAEGVETTGQAELLRERGCDFFQGFYFSKPLSAAEMREFLLSARKAGES
ncbi:MAG: phosphodiesterase [Gammaproteobacteria bacterium]|nr:phosphodiesterase [Gammaproteobacteria bacterium]